MTPRKRLAHNKGLPKRWEWYHGAYHYRIPRGQEALWDGKRTRFRLGKTLAEAHSTFAERMRAIGDARTMAQLLDRYSSEVTPTKAPRTQTEEWRLLRLLREIFGDTPVLGVTPRHCYQVRDTITAKRGPTTANRHLEVLSHVFTKAIEWGLVTDHPVKGKVVKNKLRPERRYVEDWEIRESLKAASPLIRAYVKLKLLTGLRMTDMLSLRWSDIKADGVHVHPRKTASTSGKRLVIAFDDEGHLEATLDEIRGLRRPTASVWLFCNRWGQPYVKQNGTCSGFQSIWQRWMAKAVKETGLKERFKERWLRTKVGSDSIDATDAAERLAHSNVETARRHYREKPTVVRPLVKSWDIE